MSQPTIVNDRHFEYDALHQAIKSYKDALRTPEKDLDVEYLMKTLDYVNGICPVKIARNPIGKDRQWVHETQLHNVRGFYIDDEGRLTIRTRGDEVELVAEKAFEQIEELQRNHIVAGAVFLERTGKEPVAITDAYSHAFVGDVYSGMPFSLVLAYFEED